MRRARGSVQTAAPVAVFAQPDAAAFLFSRAQRRRAGPAGGLLPAASLGCRARAPGGGGLFWVFFVFMCTHSAALAPHRALQTREHTPTRTGKLAGKRDGTRRQDSTVSRRVRARRAPPDLDRLAFLSPRLSSCASPASPVSRGASTVRRSRRAGQIRKARLCETLPQDPAPPQLQATVPSPILAAGARALARPPRAGRAAWRGPSVASP